VWEHDLACDISTHVISHIVLDSNDLISGKCYQYLFHFFLFLFNVSRIQSLMYLWEIHLKILEILLQRENVSQACSLKGHRTILSSWQRDTVKVSETKNCLPRVNQS